METLIVWYQQTEVGTLTLTNSQLKFEYNPNWIESGFQISQTLPLNQNTFDGNLFFGNLLPEASARLHIVNDLKIPDSDFELLKALGGECAGALSILAKGDNPSQNNQYKKITNDALSKLLKKRGNYTHLVDPNERPRLSLAGAQDKLPILEKEDHYYLPERNAPSSHILKFDVLGYKHIPAYEYVLNELARSINLPTVETELKKYEDHHYLLIKRYDRKIENNNIERIHQEDFCQALGYSHLNKYQKNNGPSFSNCYQLTESISSNPIEDCRNLLKWQIFNVLAGNSDGHAKNLALVYSEKNNTRLAPFYDLVCTRAIERLDVNLAFSIGRQYNPGKLTSKDWETLSNESGVKFSYLKNLITELCEKLPEKFQEIRSEFEKNHGEYPALQRVESVINKQCKKTLKNLS